MDFLRIFQKPTSQVAERHTCGFSRVDSCDQARALNRIGGEQHELQLHDESASWLLPRAGAVP
jgi:hypothetical protein